jgi:hypothetical protein
LYEGGPVHDLGIALYGETGVTVPLAGKVGEVGSPKRLGFSAYHWNCQVKVPNPYGNSSNLPASEAESVSWLLSRRHSMGVIYFTQIYTAMELASNLWPCFRYIIPHSNTKSSILE